MSRLYPGDLACPHCGASESKVKNTQGNKAGDCINRRRECLGCGKRFTSYERLPDALLHEQVERLHAEVERLRALLRRGICA